MNRYRVIHTMVLYFIFSFVVFAQGKNQDSEAYLQWKPEQAKNVGMSMYSKGRAGGYWDTRVISTNKSYNYKLAATWLTPDVIRATARLKQLESRLTLEQTKALVQQAESITGTVVLVEIDPREGSGIIPGDWQAFLQPKGAAPESGLSVAGISMPSLRGIKSLAGVQERNFDYDRFWIVFPSQLPDGRPLFSDTTSEAELIVRISQKEGRVSWIIPSSFRDLQRN